MRRGRRRGDSSIARLADLQGEVVRLADKVAARLRRIDGPALLPGPEPFDAGAAPWGGQLDDVLLGASAASCMSCHQSGDPAVQFGLQFEAAAAHRTAGVDDQHQRHRRIASFLALLATTATGPAPSGATVKPSINS